MTRRNLAAICSTIGSVVVAATLWRPHPWSFIFFLMLGVPLLLLGMVIYLWPRRRRRASKA
jgi:predicted membrane channel-forming protein YqfA (hemolysin III family)